MLLGLAWGDLNSQPLTHDSTMSPDTTLDYKDFTISCFNGIEHAGDSPLPLLHQGVSEANVASTERQRRISLALVKERE